MCKGCSCTLCTCLVYDWPRREAGSKLSNSWTCIWRSLCAYCDHCMYIGLRASGVQGKGWIALQSQGPALLGKFNRSICQTKIILNLVFSYLIMYIYWQICLRRGWCSSCTTLLTTWPPRCWLPDGCFLNGQHQCQPLQWGCSCQPPSVTSPWSTIIFVF